MWIAILTSIEPPGESAVPERVVTGIHNADYRAPSTSNR